MHRVLLIAILAISAAAIPVDTIVGRRIGKSIYVPVQVAGHGPFWFAFDSGAYVTVIDPFLMKRLHLKTIATGTVRGTGQGEVPVRHTTPLTMTVGKTTLAIADPYVIDLSGAGNPEWMHGLIGASLLEAYVVEMDPDRPSLRLFDPRTFTKPADAVALPLENANHRFFMHVTIDVNPHETIERRVRIDTGSEDSVDDPEVKNGRNVRATTLGNGLGSNYQSVSGIVDAVHVGPFTIRDVWAPGAPNPTIGMEILRRFTVTFDVPHGVIYLKPNRHLGEPVPPPT
jgi:hypothetical protein